MTSCLIQCRMC